MKRKALICSIIALVMLVSFMTSARSVFSSSLSDIQKKIDAEKGKNSDVQAELRDVEKKIADKEREMEETSEKCKELIRQQAEQQSQIATQELELEELFGQIEEINNTISEAEAEYEAALLLFFNRTKVIYKYSKSSSLELFTQSKNLFAYRDLTRILDNMLERDKEDMEELRIMKQDLELKKQIAEDMKADVETAIREKEAVIEKLKNDQEILEEDLVASRGALRKLEDLEDEMLAESDRIAAEIKKLQNEYQKAYDAEQKRLAEERARKEAEERARKEAEEKARQEEAERRAAQEGKLLWPSPVTTRITSDFGWRVHPIYGYDKFHNGIDIGAYGGSNILAAADGVVITAKYSSSYGNYVVIYHGNEMTTLYAHSSKLLVKEGDQVKRGQVIALVGSTGASTGNHLHFEVRINGDPVNPLDYVLR